jgi:hypothetical protein
METYNPMNQTIDFAERMERLYPETAAVIAPYAREMVDEMDEEAVEAVSNQEIARMAEDAAHRSGMAANMPAGHNSGTLNELATALVVRELIDRHRRGRGGRFPYFLPFFYLPFEGHGHGFGSFHGFDRGFGHADRGRGFGHGFGGTHRF